MNRKWTVIGIILVFLVSLTIVLTFPRTPISEPSVGIYYYPWYMEEWTTSHSNCPDTPYLGKYDSANLSVIMQHLNWFRKLGIDFIIFSWWGKDSPSDINTNLVLNQIRKNYTDLQFFIMVEEFTDDWQEAYNEPSDTYNFSLIYDYIYSNYIEEFRSNIFHLDGKPVIGFYNNPEKTFAKSVVPNDERFSLRIIGCNADDDWEYQVPNQDLSNQPVCRDGEISVCPRYDANGWLEDLNYTEGLYDAQWSKAVSEVKTGNVRIITIISWNEYAERTQIEPTVDTTSAFKDNPFYLFDKTLTYIESVKSVPEENEVNICLHLSDYGCSTISYLTELGVKWVRTDWLLTYDNSMRDYSQKLQDNSINLLAIVNMSKFGDQIDLVEWNETVTNIVSSEGFNNTDAVEVCNEPNHTNYTIPAETYYEMLKSAYAIIKDYVDIPVVFAGVSPNSGGWQDYLNAVFAHDDVEDYFDYMGIHFYYDDMEENLSVLQFVEELTSKPIWLTETGKPSDEENYTETMQAEYLRSVCSTFEPLVDKMFIYELKDDQGLFPPKENYFGLLTIEGKQKEAYWVVCDINRK